VTGGWRKLYNEELRDLYSLPSIIRMITSRNGYKVFPSMQLVYCVSYTLLFYNTTCFGYLVAIIRCEYYTILTKSSYNYHNILVASKEKLYTHLFTTQQDAPNPH
jgi:hypothetical protein